jgi:hypothetical protein
MCAMSAADIRILFRRLPHPQQLALFRELKEEISRDPLPPDRAGLFGRSASHDSETGISAPIAISRTWSKTGATGCGSGTGAGDATKPSMT